MNKILQKNTRLDYLDAVRAFALILGIVFHASLSFMPMFIGWAVMDISTSAAVSIFVQISHSFRMELFFLMAGFFSHMTFHGKGAMAFLKSRWVRIAIPFMLGWFLLRPLLVSAWVMGSESMRGEVNILNALHTGFAELSHFPSGLFVGTHLWFLYYMILVTVSLFALRFLFSLHASIQRAVSQVVDATVLWVSNSRFAIIAVSIPTAGCLWFMDHWGMDTPDKTLIPKIPVLLVYGGFFIFGWLFHRQRSLIESFSRLTWGKCVLFLLAAIATILLTNFEMKLSHSYYTLLKLTFSLSYAILMWSLIALTIGLFKKWFNRPRKIVRYIADASYWLYLTHLPIVIWLQIAFAELAIHWSIKLVAISTITIIVLLISYDLFVRNTFIGATLSGKRKPRMLLMRRNTEQRAVYGVGNK